MKEKVSETLPVTVDKSHLIVIGEKLYAESVELLRELVNNAYDADATEVNIIISDTKVIVDDNGVGMNLEGLRQYFAIGSQKKVRHPLSKVYKRPRIGQFGIGKFATLSACNRFEVFTQRDKFAAVVTFDKKMWQESGNTWELPLKSVAVDPSRGNGTTVTLSELTKKFAVNEVEERLRESTPLKAPHFIVKINGRKIKTHKIDGYRIPVLEGTKYGPVHGEIIIIPATKASSMDIGIECKVKQVTIKREVFSLMDLGKEAARVKGEINADFLPITSDRSNFIVDSPEYREFIRAMDKVLAEVRSALSRLSDKRENRKAKTALREALKRIEKALNLDQSEPPRGLLPLADKATNAVGDAALISGQDGGRQSKGETLLDELRDIKPKKKKRRRKTKAKELTPHAVVRKLKIGNLGVTCCLDHFGPEGPECFTEETVIFINRDHPLYIREAKKKEAGIMYISRLLSQEISLMKNPRNPRQAYELQSKILKKAFID